MNPTPKGWPRISASVFYSDAAKAIDFLCAAFGFECAVRIEGKNGRIEHSQLTFGDGMIMVGQTGEELPDRKNAGYRASPKQLGGKCTAALMLFVDDADAHCAHARKAGATITMEPETHDHGEEWFTDRTYQAADPEGHRWYFVQRLRTGAKQH